MPSQFFGLSISYSGLLASNAALNTTRETFLNFGSRGDDGKNEVFQSNLTQILDS